MYDPIKFEEEIGEYWEKHKIIEKAYKLRAKKPKFRFLEGPPTVNAEPHVGHFRGRAIKDTILKYKLLKGFYPWHQAGWDMQGIPVELQVEKKLGMKSKRDIESYGVEKFVEECKNLVLEYKKKWEYYSKRFGMWLDFKKPYMTMTDDHIEFEWWTVKKAFEKNMLITKTRTVPWCPRCSTSLSSHEVAQGYKEVEDPSIYLRFKVKGKENEYLLVWTTTPWTLVANLALTVNPDLTYAKVKVGEEYYILAKDLVEKVAKEVGWENYEIKEEIKGSELEGLSYEPILKEEVPKQAEFEEKGFYKVILSDLPTLEKGSGIVHIAPGHGPEDYELGTKKGLPVFSPVNEIGEYTEEGGKFAGKYVFDANKEIIELLKEKGILIHEGKIKHEYPTCWRCKTKLIFRGSKEWFFKIEPIKNIMIEENKKVKWLPPQLSKRFEDWLKNAVDWNISRKRYWGSPLPIWICDKCGKIEVIGSKEELKKKAKKLPKELHKPWVDEITWKCSGKGNKKCDGTMRRVPEVADVWLDSGVVPGATLGGGYLKNEKKFWEWYPAEFITEAIDQTRGWYYTLLFSNVMAFGKAPYELILNQGFVLDERGKKMSKSEGNVVWAREIFSEGGIGADVYRFYILWKNEVWDSINFSLKEAKLIYRMFNAYWNMIKMLNETIETLKINRREINKVKKEKIEDEWILSKVNSVLQKVDSYLNNYQLTKAAREIYDFVLEDTSRTYIQLIRDRLNEKEKAVSALSVLNYVLKKINFMIAPYAPHLAEKCYFELKGKEKSIFFEEWPEVEKEYIKEVIEEDFEKAKEIISTILAIRDKVKIGVRWPLKEALIYSSNEKLEEILEDFKDLILKQTNVKEIKIINKKPEWISYKTRLNHSELAKAFKEDEPKVVGKLIEISPESIRKKFEKGEKIEIEVDGKKYEINEKQIEIVESLPEEWSSEKFSEGTIYLYLVQDSELIKEGIAREVSRKIQALRKKEKMKKSEKATVYISGDEEVKEAVKEFKKLIEEKTNCEIEVLGKVEAPEEKIRNYKVRISLVK